MCRIGPKKLINDYIDEVIRQFNIISENTFDDFPLAEKYEFMSNVQKSFGRSALLLSGGGCFGFTHAGVVKCLLECGLLPKIISGASVGSIIAGFVGTKKDEDLVHLLDSRNLNLVRPVDY
jgi:hypothetical protein